MKIPANLNIGDPIEEASGKEGTAAPFTEEFLEDAMEIFARINVHRAPQKWKYIHPKCPPRTESRLP